MVPVAAATLRPPAAALRGVSVARTLSPGFSPSHLGCRVPFALFSAQPAHRWLAVARPRLAPARAQDGGDSEPAPAEPPASTPAPAPGGSGSGSLVGSIGLWLLWAALAVYAFLLAPNQTPLRDQYFLEKLVGLGANDGVAINAVFTQLFFIMGVWPLVYTGLLIPAGRSRTGVPAWPFVIASYGVGAFGLLPFFALWQPPSPPPQLPAKKKDLEGPGNLMQKGFETPIPAVLALLGAVSCIVQATAAGPAAWAEYGRLLEESRFVHVTTLDFLTLTSLAPFWMANDAELRKWEGRDKLLPVLSLIPVLGPAMYLCLRPRAKL
eukprot:scaffold1.g5755.t1